MEVAQGEQAAGIEPAGAKPSEETTAHHEQLLGKRAGHGGGERSDYSDHFEPDADIEGGGSTQAVNNVGGPTHPIDDTP